MVCLDLGLVLVSIPPWSSQCLRLDTVCLVLIIGLDLGLDNPVFGGVVILVRECLSL